MDKQEKKSKIKTWWNDNKDKIKGESVRIGYYALGCGIGWFVGKKFANAKTAAGLSHAHDVGLFKLFDPRTGSEVDVIQAIEVAKEVL